MKRFLTILIHILFYFTSTCQGLVAEMKYVFIDGEDKGIYTGGIKIKSGIINVNDVIKVVDDGGNNFELKVLEIQDNDTDESAKSLSAGKEGFLVLETIDKKKIDRIVGGFHMGSNQLNNKANENNLKNIATKCKLDGKAWQGVNYFKSSSYFPTGNSLLKTSQPYLIISFKSSVGKDNRQITLINPNFKTGKGILNKNSFEIAISGSEDGNPANSCIASNWEGGNANTKHSDFYFEFTKWEDKGSYILCSGIYHGKLYGFNPMKGLTGTLCKDVTITEGSFEDLKVEKN